MIPRMADIKYKVLVNSKAYFSSLLSAEVLSSAESISRLLSRASLKIAFVIRIVSIWFRLSIYISPLS